MISASWNCILFCVKSMVVYSDQREKHIKLVHPSTPISDRQNISLQYQYNINKMRIKKYQFGNKLIQY